MSGATPGDDVLYGTEGGDYLDGGAGNDQIFGLGRGDILIGGSGSDRLDGGLGSDFASYSGSSAWVFASLKNGAVHGGDADGDVLVSIENLIGSTFADMLDGDDGANWLDGHESNDMLAGWGGDDELIGGAGADSLNGGDGTDTADYSGSTGVVVDLFAGTISGGDAAGDTLTSIENISGGGYNDYLVGTSGANVLQGRAGDDVLIGARGADTLIGGAGADRFLYVGTAHSPVGAAADRITDFTRGQGDRVDLYGIDANATAVGNQAFSFIGTGLYTGVAGQLRFAFTSPGITTIAGDVDGDKVSDFHITLTRTIALVAADFVL
ncbi:calcium-binding protein [Mycobacterium sp. KBS0706]|uniref:calcium-binding protein n=1 Tax=Mycobacterium sp. KBS0706 TaxID=2578109 RepID=UPI00110F6DB9|nr:calcium-binding protein [Mycobacterium sp. KBS0706]TSD87755.1 calcium-binding protein [Mycobacterium sp. KBS0706]